MMSYMEVATYLGILNTALANSEFLKEIDDAELNINNKIIEALATAQLTMYELARKELEKMAGGDEL